MVDKNMSDFADCWFAMGVLVLMVVSTNAFLLDLTLVEDAVAKGAVCLDGSPPGYHLSKGFGSGVNNWLVHFEGGSWCNNITTCSARTKTRLGSSKYMSKQVQFSGLLVCLDGSPPGYHLSKGFGSGVNNWLVHFEGGSWCNNITTCSARTKTRLGSSKYMSKQVRFSGLLGNSKAKNPVCLDGSPPGYHLSKGFGSGVNNWLVHFEGGSWCNNITTCSARTKTRLGSSKYMSKQVQFSGLLGNSKAKNPACLDGSPPGYYLSKGFGSGVNNWLVHFEGGSWCNNIITCSARTKTRLGSSKYMSKQVQFLGLLGNSKAKNPGIYSSFRCF